MSVGNLTKLNPEKIYTKNHKLFFRAYFILNSPNPNLKLCRKHLVDQPFCMTRNVETLVQNVKRDLRNENFISGNEAGANFI